MSYCRFSEGDVYAYECTGGVQFWTPDDALNRLCSTYNEAYQYAKILRSEHGLRVPDHAIEALRLDSIDEAKRFTGPDSAVSEMIAENAKLRELVRLMHGTIKDMQETFGASVVVGGVELSAEYFDSEYMRELGIEANDD